MRACRYQNEEDMKYALRKLDDSEFESKFTRSKSVVRVREEKRGGGGGGARGGGDRDKDAGGSGRRLVPSGPPMPYHATSDPEVFLVGESCFCCVTTLCQLLCVTAWQIP